MLRGEEEEEDGVTRFFTISIAREGEEGKSERTRVTELSVPLACYQLLNRCLTSITMDISKRR